MNRNCDSFGSCTNATYSSTYISFVWDKKWSHWSKIRCCMCEKFCIFYFRCFYGNLTRCEGSRSRQCWFSSWAVVPPGWYGWQLRLQVTNLPQIWQVMNSHYYSYYTSLIFESHAILAAAELDLDAFNLVIRGLQYCTAHSSAKIVWLNFGLAWL